MARSAESIAQRLARARYRYATDQEFKARRRRRQRERYSSDPQYRLRRQASARASAAKYRATQDSRAKARIRQARYRQRLLACPENRAAILEKMRTAAATMRQAPEFRAKVAAYWKSDAGRLARKGMNYRRRIRVRAAGGPITTPAQRSAILARTGGLCLYCRSGDRVVLDHFNPISSGGSDAPDNLIPSCWRCNSSKRGTDPYDWAMRLRGSAVLRRALDFLEAA